ncbi:MAG: hypothetical protein JSW64_02640 [Candidatus Zixiibacteriota bacterium]|nr:MAG: hypothetical protein JSW64_02640 [candidate division Zixibacteria bacterium]
MKMSLLSTLLIAIIILINCSGDRAVVDRIITDNDIANSNSLSEVPDPQYPPEYGDIGLRPPYYIMVVYGIMDTIGFSCELLVCAVPMDFYGYPYPGARLEVRFQVAPESLASINHTAYTNENGAALAKLVYPAENALQEVQLVVSCVSVADTLTILLPIYRPDLGLNAFPEKLWAEQPGAYDTSIVACRLTNVFDNPIGGGRIVFRALVAGEICGPTSVYTDDHGWAYTQYRIRYEDIPDGHNDPNFIETAVRSTLFGYPDVEEEISLFCYRP